jgi:hypothetical protein
MPVAFARERLGAHLDIPSNKQGGRARQAQEGLARNKRRSGFTREAPRGRRSISPSTHQHRRTSCPLTILCAYILSPPAILCEPPYILSLPQSCVNTRTPRPLTNLCEHPFTQLPLSRTLRDCDSVCRIAESLVKTGFCAVTSCRLAARTGADQSLQSPHRSPLPGQRSSSGDSDVR